MFDRRLRFSLACIVLAALPAGAVAGQSRPPRFEVAPNSRLVPGRQAPSSRARAASSACSTEGSGGFVGGGASNVSGGANSGILSGQVNEACDQLSVIVGGDSNTIYGNGGTAAEESFIGAGANNDISSYHSGIGAGVANTVSGTNAFLASGNTNDIAGNHDFIGSGDFQMVSGSGSAIVSGDYQYFINGGTAFGNQVTGRDSFIGAGDVNSVSGGGSVIGGGDYIYAVNGNVSIGNQVSGDDSFLGAGDQNVISGEESFIGSGAANAIGNASYAAIAGGSTNTANGPASFIGSGTNNTVSAAAGESSIVGGSRNSVAGQYASVLGGFGNSANGEYAMVAGGNGDLAQGMLSFAAGYHVSVTHSGSFAWSDYSSGSNKLADTANNQFLVRSSGGVFLYSNEAETAGVELAPGSGTWSSLSDRNAKSDIVPLDGDAILAKVAALPVDAWQYRSERGVRHIGPMAQDFYVAFGVGEDDRHVTSIDEDGVSLAAVKALNVKLDRENHHLRENVASLQAAQRRDEAELRVLALAIGSEKKTTP